MDNSSSWWQTDLPPDSCSTFPLSRRLWPVPVLKGWCFLPDRQPITHCHFWLMLQFLFGHMYRHHFLLFPLSASLSSGHHTLSEPHVGLCLSTAVTTQQLSPCFPFNGTFPLCFTPSHPLSLGWSALHTSGVRCETVSLLGLISELVFCWYLDIHS